MRPGQTRTAQPVAAAAVRFMKAQSRGRWIVAAIIIVTLVGHGVFVVLPAVQKSGETLGGTLLGCCIVAAVLYALWRGYSWARWLFFMSSVIGLAWTAWLSFRWPDPFVVSKAIQAGIIALLLASPSVTVFMS